MAQRKSRVVTLRMTEADYNHVTKYMTDDSNVSATVMQLVKQAIQQDRADADKWTRLVERIEAADVTAIGDDLSIRLSAVMDGMRDITRMLKRHDLLLQEYARARLVREDLYLKMIKAVEGGEAANEQ